MFVSLNFAPHREFHNFLREMETKEEIIFEYSVVDGIICDKNDFFLDENSQTLQFNSVELNESKCGEWSKPMLLRMLELYTKLVKKVGPLNQFRLRRDMWQFITEKINIEFSTNFTFTQVNSK